jgi:murein DD-endopeptidase MepM/ murein hydrolase activator NlpD
VYNAALAASSGVVTSGDSKTKTAATGKTAGAPPRTLTSQAEDLKSAKARALAAKTAAAEKAAKPAQKLAQNSTTNVTAQKKAAATSVPGSAAVTAKPETVRTAKLEPARDAKGPHDPAPAAAPEQTKTGAPASETANPEFRWPARGRIIQAFKSGGNDGINIAVPEGTSVKAAESGVVAYAGNELKGYGNLILIRGILKSSVARPSSAAKRSPNPGKAGMSRRRNFISNCARARRRSIQHNISPVFRRLTQNLFDP